MPSEFGQSLPDNSGFGSERLKVNLNANDSDDDSSPPAKRRRMQSPESSHSIVRICPACRSSRCMYARQYSTRRIETSRERRLRLERRERRRLRRERREQRHQRRVQRQREQEHEAQRLQLQREHIANMQRSHQTYGNPNAMVPTLPGPHPHQLTPPFGSTSAYFGQYGYCQPHGVPTPHFGPCHHIPGHLPTQNTYFMPQYGQQYVYTPNYTPQPPPAHQYLPPGASVPAILGNPPYYGNNHGVHGALSSAVYVPSDVRQGMDTQRRNSQIGHPIHANPWSPSSRNTSVGTGTQHVTNPILPAHGPGFIFHFLGMYPYHHPYHHAVQVPILQNQTPPRATATTPTNANLDSFEAENYEALLSLAERLGDARPRGLSRTDILLLPTYTYGVMNSENDDKEQASCVICICDFEINQTIRVLPCTHEFHVKCIDKWLKVNRTCPICRGDAGELAPTAYGINH